jgi:hypothetical protein
MNASGSLRVRFFLPPSPPCGAGSRYALAPPIGLPQHVDEHRPEYPTLIAVDQQPGRGSAGPEAGSVIGSRTQAPRGAIAELLVGRFAAWPRAPQWPSESESSCGIRFYPLGTDALLSTVL